MKSQQSIKKTNILIVSDDRLAQKSLYEMLCRNGHAVNAIDPSENPLSHLNENPHQVVLVDKIDISIKILNIIKDKKFPSQVIILTSYGNTEHAVDIIKRGAFDYLVRPVEDKKVLSTVERALANIQNPAKEHISIKSLFKKENTYHGLVGKSPHLKNIYSLIERISDTKTTILIRGESGTGKRMIAHAIHQADKHRRHKPFIEVSCGALPKEIIESELFGHIKGSFTGAIVDRKGRFEMAHGGTILLDDIDSFSLDLQVKLLRVLQQKEFERVGEGKTVKVDVRIISSTNQDLEKAVKEGRFREDLYYRLNVISLKLPPLRDRKEDLGLLIEHFVSLFSKENHKKIKGVSPDAQRVLSGYNWPGNIRELENIIERGVILDVDNVIDVDDLPEALLSKVETVNGNHPLNYTDTSLKDILREPEKVYILKIMQEVGWNKKKAAIKLGVNRTTLYNKLRRYNLLSCANKQ